MKSQRTGLDLPSDPRRWPATQWLLVAIIVLAPLVMGGRQPTGRVILIAAIGLLATVILLFGFQAETILGQPQTILLIAIPLLVQTYGIFAIAYGAAYWLRLEHKIAAPACLIGSSNFFELAVAVAISLFGLHSGAALATVVGVLVEVPVMLSLVAFANRTAHWFR